MKGQMEQRLREGLHAEAEQVDLDDERKETLLRDIHVQIRERSHTMKKFTAGRKIIAVAAALVVLGAGAVMGAGKASVYFSSTNVNDVRYRTAADLKKETQTMGSEPKAVDTFTDGTSFEKGYFHMVEGMDDAGNKVESYPEITIDYSNDVTMTISRNQIEMYGDYRTDEYQGISLYTKSENFLMLPPDAEPSEEDRKAADEGRLSISYGTDEEVRETFHYVKWEEDGLTYMIHTFDDSYTDQDLLSMAKEVIDVK